MKSWIHEAIHGYPPDAIQNSTSGRDKIRKCKVSPCLTGDAQRLTWQRILLLSGPAGAGKTTTVRVVAKEMGVELMEWGEGADDAIVGAGVGKSVHLRADAMTDE